MNRTRWAILRAMVLWAALPLFANAANVSIEPQPLGSALQDLAKQSNVQIIFFSKAVEGRRAPALNGTYTPEEAVALLLEGSGLTYYVLNERTIEVAAKPEVAEKPVTPLPSPGIPVRATPLDEVEIIASREKLETMREEIRALNDRYYAEYNKINTRDQYDIVCMTQERGRHRPAQRVCEPAFVRDARLEAAAVRANDPCAPSARLIVLMKTARYQEEMADVLANRPELRALRQEIIERIEAFRQQSVRGRAAPDAAVKGEISSRASAAALIATLGGCLPKERYLRTLPMDEWAVAKGLEPVEIEGDEYFCIPQPGASHPIRDSRYCASLAHLRQARFDGRSSPGYGPNGFAYAVDGTSSGQAITFSEQAALHGVPGYP